MEQRTRIWQEGQQLAKQERWDESIDRFLRLVELEPDFNEAKVQAALLLLRQDRYRAARELTLAAAHHSHIHTPQLAIEVARLLRRFEEPEILSGLLGQVDWKTGSSVPLLHEAARLLSTSGLHSQALDLVQQSLLLEPGSAHGLYMRGSIHLFAGDRDAAHADFIRSLRIAPLQPHVHWMLSLDSDSKQRDAAIAAIQAIAAKAIQPEGRAYLGYALHNHFHAAGRWDESWQSLAQACQVKRQLVAYSADSQRRLTGALKVMDLSAGAGGSPPAEGNGGLIFIVGMHRSGTTLLERMLGGHPLVADGGETYVFTARMSLATDHHCRAVVDDTTIARAQDVDWKEVASGFRRYARWRANGRPWLTEKLPSNFLNLGFILKALPEAKVLHMMRDPVDTCFSNLRTYFSQAAGYSYDQNELADYYVQYRQLMAHWRALAPERILDVDYAALVTDPEAEARRVLAFCGLPFNSNVLEVERTGGVVATASVAHAREGIRGDRGKAWQPYARHLQPLLEGLAPVTATQSDTDG